MRNVTMPSADGVRTAPSVPPARSVAASADHVTSGPATLTLTKTGAHTWHA